MVYTQYKVYVETDQRARLFELNCQRSVPGDSLQIAIGHRGLFLESYPSQNECIPSLLYVKIYQTTTSPYFGLTISDSPIALLKLS